MARRGPAWLALLALQAGSAIAASAYVYPGSGACYTENVVAGVVGQNQYWTIDRESANARERSEVTCYLGQLRETLYSDEFTAYAYFRPRGGERRGVLFNNDISGATPDIRFAFEDTADPAKTNLYMKFAGNNIRECEFNSEMIQLTAWNLFAMACDNQLCRAYMNDALICERQFARNFQTNSEYLQVGFDRLTRELVRMDLAYVSFEDSLYVPRTESPTVSPVSSAPTVSDDTPVGNPDQPVTGSPTGTPSLPTAAPTAAPRSPPGAPGPIGANPGETPAPTSSSGVLPGGPGTKSPEENVAPLIPVESQGAIAGGVGAVLGLLLVRVTVKRCGRRDSLEQNKAIPLNASGRPGSTGSTALTVMTAASVGSSQYSTNAVELAQPVGAPRRANDEIPQPRPPWRRMTLRWPVFSFRPVSLDVQRQGAQPIDV